MKVLTILLRAFGLTYAYALTLGYCFAIRGFWSVNDSTDLIPRLITSLKASYYTSMFILISVSFIAILTLPLASWSIGSTSLSLIRKPLFAFWLILMLIIIFWPDADILAIVTGVGLLTIWILRNRKMLIRTTSQIEESLHTEASISVVNTFLNFVVLAILILISFLLYMYFLYHRFDLFSGTIITIYTTSCIFQACRACLGLFRSQHAVNS